MNPEEPDPPAGTVRGGRVSPRDRFLLALLAVVVLTAAVFGGLAFRHRSNGDALTLIRPSGIPTTVTTAQANLMALSPVPTRQAPDFHFTDQNGRPVSLSGLRGHVVVLSFTDPHCTDVCPIVSQETVDAYRDLGEAASEVLFLSVNVNPYVTSVANMATYSDAHHLSRLPSWHFLTGPVPDLQSAWHAYGIEVNAPDPTADVQHTDALYFIDPQGRERFVASPRVDHRADGASFLPADQLASWGRGIAAVSRQLTSA